MSGSPQIHGTAVDMRNQIFPKPKLSEQDNCFHIENAKRTISYACYTAFSTMNSLLLYNCFESSFCN